jgi:hypothetical protein
MTDLDSMSQLEHDWPGGGESSIRYRASSFLSVAEN